MVVDYIIVGQGIAGSSVAFQLIEAGYSIKVIDALEEGQASRIASGIWNPVVLKRMKKVWLADEMLQELMPFYQRVEQIIQERIIDDTRVLRLFSNALEANEWLTICDKPAFSTIVSDQIIHLNNEMFENTQGLGLVEKSGRIDTNMWLSGYRQWLNTNAMLDESVLIYDALDIESEHVKYRNLIAKKGIIFCEGMHAAMLNPFFKQLPFALTKGETLDIYVPELNLNYIVNAGVFVLPLGDDVYKVGATYAWHASDKTPTIEGRHELLRELEKFLKVKYEVVAHHAGIRPTVKDRRPLLGTHRDFKNVHIFNGMGSRGVLMAPYLSKVFIDYLGGKTELPKEADIKRFF